jgi:hypothetical protein
MTYDEWITFGIMQGFCTTAACVSHNVWELYEAVPYLTEEDLEHDEPPCVPGVILFPPEDKS